MTSYYNSWKHARQLLFSRFLEFIYFTFIIGLVFWYAWVKYYLGVGFWWGTKEAVLGDSELLKPLIIMCFINSAFATGWIFTVLLRGKSRSVEQHHRGSKLRN